MEPAREELQPGLRPPRFGLATLFWFIALLCVCFAIIAALRGPTVLWLTVLALAILAHVAGNALGTRLRERGRGRGARSEGPGPRGGLPLQPSDFAPATRLGERHSLGWPSLVSAVTGALTCAGLACYGLLALYGDAITWINLLLGTLAAAVLGGIWTFGAAALLQVAWASWRQAQRGK